MLQKFIKYVLPSGVLLVIVYLLFFDFYEVASTSMIPAIRPGAYLVIKKLFTGAMATSVEIKKNKIYVFNKPVQHAGDSQVVFVKRCVGVPGDTVHFKRGELDPRYPSRIKDTLHRFYYPHNKLFTWSNNDFGPLWIPGKGRDILLTPASCILYGDMIRGEKNTLEVVGDTLFLVNGKPATRYRFKQNYYFMMGDNFYESEDSRVFGPVPEINILGKVIVIL
jgi:signal peptidase I